MTQPWDEFLSIYREKLEDKPHGDAVIDALVGLMFRLDELGWTTYGERSARLKEVTDQWDEEGGSDWDDLRERLEQGWSEAE